MTNFSTGRTGAFLADWLTEKGAVVTALCAESAVIPFKAKRSLKFRSFQDLDSLLRKTLEEDMYDAVIHSAAVSDFCVEGIDFDDQRVEGPYDGKLMSQGKISVHLKPTYKIVDRIKKYARHRVPVLVAFKLTDTTSEKDRDTAVAKLFSQGNVDYVVHNDLKGMGTGNAHQFEIYGEKIRSLAKGSTKDELSQAIYRLILEQKRK